MQAPARTCSCFQVRGITWKGRTWPLRRPATIGRPLQPFQVRGQGLVTLTVFEPFSLPVFTMTYTL